MAKVHLELGVWCRLNAQLGILIRINVGTIAPFFQMRLQGSESSTVRRDQFEFLSRAPSRYGSVVKRPKPRQNILCSWCCRCFSRCWGISTDNQPIYLVFLAVAVKERSLFADHQRRCPKCMCLCFSKDPILVMLLVPVAVLVGRVVSLWRVSRNVSVGTSVVFCSVVLQYVQISVQHAKRRFTSPGTTVAS